MTSREERIQRIRDLLEDRRHPERQVGILSATNLTRFGLRFGAMLLAAIAVRSVIGPGPLAGLVTLAAVAAADGGVTWLWKRIGESVRKAWGTVGVLAAAALVLAAVTGQLSPGSRGGSIISGWFNGWVEAQRAKLDQRQRASRIAVDTTAADEHWIVLNDSGFVRMGTLAEVNDWCAALGPGWKLPPGLGTWPQLERYPALARITYAWTWSGSGIQIGDGQRPAVGVSSTHRPGEVHAVLCWRDS